MDLRWLASVALSFDFTQPVEPMTQATRWIDVEFFGGNGWLRLARFRQNRTAEADLSNVIRGRLVLPVHCLIHILIV
jgi:hypothetical protein